MEVTHDNYWHLLPLIIDSIRSADLISIDSEFSGKSIDLVIL
jgi:hypothetical protein